MNLLKKIFLSIIGLIVALIPLWLGLFTDYFSSGVLKFVLPTIQAVLLAMYIIIFVLHNWVNQDFNKSEILLIKSFLSIVGFIVAVIPLWMHLFVNNSSWSLFSGTQLSLLALYILITPGCWFPQDRNNLRLSQ